MQEDEEEGEEVEEGKTATSTTKNPEITTMNHMHHEHTPIFINSESTASKISSRRINIRQQQNKTNKLQINNKIKLLQPLPRQSTQLNSIGKTFKDRIKNYYMGNFGFVPNMRQ